MKLYAQKIFAGDRWFLIFGLLFATMIGYVTFTEGVDWVDISFLFIYFFVLLGAGIWSASYPDLRVSKEGLAIRRWFWFDEVGWEAVEEITPYPEDFPIGFKMKIKRRRISNIVVRRKSINDFEELLDLLEEYIPEDRWVGWEELE